MYVFIFWEKWDIIALKIYIILGLVRVCHALFRTCRRRSCKGLSLRSGYFVWSVIPNVLASYKVKGLAGACYTSWLYSSGTTWLHRKISGTSSSSPPSPFTLNGVFFNHLEQTDLARWYKFLLGPSGRPRALCRGTDGGGLETCL